MITFPIKVTFQDGRVQHIVAFDDGSRSPWIAGTIPWALPTAPDDPLLGTMRRLKLASDLLLTIWPSGPSCEHRVARRIFTVLDLSKPLDQEPGTPL